MFSSEKKSEALPVIKKCQRKKIAIAKPLRNWPQSTDLIKWITHFSTDKNTASLASTSRFLYHSTKDILDIRKLKALAHHVVVNPNEDKVTAMLTLDPMLINVVIKEIIDNSGRILINNTIFQLAYGAGDPEMCLAIKPFFVNVYGSEKVAIQEMERQRTEKFAEDKEADQQAKDHLDTLLNPVIEAITNEAFDSGRDADKRLKLSAATMAAIETFRESFVKSQPKRIEKGMHFRNNTLLETCNVFAQAAAQWNYSRRRRTLFEDSIISCILFYAPANDAQRFSQGLSYLQHEKFTRSLALRFRKNNFYLAVRGPSIVFALSGTSIGMYGSVVLRAGRGWESGHVTNLMSNKNIKLAELMRAVEPRPKAGCCVIS